MAQPQMVQPPPDPVFQAIIDADYKPVNLKLGGPDNMSVLSGANSEEVDEENGLDFTRLNKLSKLLATNANLRCPPPPTVVSQKLSQVINGTKEEGNVCPFRCVMSSLLTIKKQYLEHVQEQKVRFGSPAIHHGCQYRRASTIVGVEPANEGRISNCPVKPFRHVSRSRRLPQRTRRC